MKYFLVIDKSSNLSKMVYAETNYHALSLVRHLFDKNLTFNDFVIKVI